MDRKMTDLFPVVVKTNIWMFMLLLKVRPARANTIPFATTNRIVVFCMVLFLSLTSLLKPLLVQQLTSKLSCLPNFCGTVREV